MTLREGDLATPCDTTPNAVTLNITYALPLLCFLPHAPCHLCYDERAQMHESQAPGREEIGWTLSQWWIR
jgi:hypothetical protein